MATPELRLSYGELAGRCALVAELLQERGVGSGIQVALAFPNSLAFLVGYFGVLQAGAIVVPLPPDLPVAGLAHRMAEGDIPYLIASGQGSGLDGPLAPVLDLPVAEGARLWRREGAMRRVEVWDGLLVRQYSSGSTGRPKAMFKSEANIAHEVRHFCTTLAVGREDVFLGAAPFFHAYGALGFLAAIHAGGSLALLPRFLPGAALEAARRAPPTLFQATPPMIQILGRCRLEPGDEGVFRSLRHCICSTGPLARDDAEAFERRFGKPVRLQYGSTETLSATVDLDGDFQEGRVGRPYDGVEVGIFDEHGNPCPPGAKGLVGVRSPAASHAYLDDLDSSARTFRNGFVFPGDAGRMDSQGRLHLLGRPDIVNVGGYKVDCLEVEAILLAALPVSAVIVTAGERAGLPVLRAVLEGDPDLVTRSMVKEVCRHRLPPYKVPELVEVIPALPRDGQGKLLRRCFTGQDFEGMDGNG